MVSIKKFNLSRTNSIVAQDEKIIMKYRTISMLEYISVIFMICFLVSMIALFIYGIISGAVDLSDLEFKFYYPLTIIFLAPYLYHCVWRLRRNTIYITEKNIITTDGKAYPLDKLWFHGYVFSPSSGERSFYIYFKEEKLTPIFSTTVECKKYDEFIAALYSVSGNAMVLFYHKATFNEAVIDFGFCFISLIGGEILDNEWSRAFHNAIHKSSIFTNFINIFRQR